MKDIEAVRFFLAAEGSFMMTQRLARMTTIKEEIQSRIPGSPV